MLQSYNTTLAAGNTVTVCTAASGHEIAIVTIEISGVQSAGVVTLTKNNGSTDVFSESFRIPFGDTVIIDSKIFLPPGYSLKALSDVAGIQISVSADDSEV